jgi:hypothetical protein
MKGCGSSLNSRSRGLVLDELRAIVQYALKKGLS